MRGRHFLLREHVAGALVFSDLIHVRIDSKLVQRAAEEHHVSRQAVDEKLAGRRDENLVASGRDVIVLVEAGLHIRIDWFARRAKIRNRAANLF